MITDDETPALELQSITRRFGTVTACRRASLSVARGEIHAVVGENGAGKSTLLQIAAGLQRADEGEIRINGVKLHPARASRAIELGLGMVQQHFLLIPEFTATENIVLGLEPRAGLQMDRTKAAREVSELAGTMGFDLDPNRLVRHLSVGEKQRVEILKILYRKAQILILDEPTAVLAPTEVEELFTLLRRLVVHGHTVVFVTHKLREVMALSDRVTVMRRGEVITTVPTKSTDVETLSALMVGETSASSGPDPLTEKQNPFSKPKGQGLRIRNLRIVDDEGIERVKGFDLDVHSGEIVGIAGVEGNGQSFLADALAGLIPASGRIQLNGHQLDGLSPKERGKLGLAHIPEDRHKRGLVLAFTTEENLILGRQDIFSTFGVLHRRRMRKNAEDAAKRFDIRPRDPSTKAAEMSGGNQQKIVVARELSYHPQVIIAAHPSRGVDIQASARIHRGLLDAKHAGAAILLISSDLMEILKLSDRIIVMYRGRLVGETAVEDASEALLSRWMVGGGHG